MDANDEGDSHATRSMGGQAQNFGGGRQRLLNRTSCCGMQSMTGVYTISLQTGKGLYVHIV